MVQTKSKLESTIGYQFKNTALLELALTHPSCDARRGNNQRLEFLGDAVLDLIVAEKLYRKFTLADEGELDRSRASLVNGHSLSNIARSINLGDFLSVGMAHRKHQPTPSKSMLEDALEAIIGAAFLDGQIPAAQTIVSRLFDEEIEQLQLSKSGKNPKGQLQEWSQRHHNGAVPTYKALPSAGPDHAKVYHAAVYVDKLLLGHGTGTSKKLAETEAANAALKQLG